MYAVRNGVHALPAGGFTPTYAGFVALVPVLIFNYVGFELPSSAAEEMRNPRRDIPLSILRSGLAALVLYGGPILGILFVLPSERIGSLGGFTDACTAVFTVYGGSIAADGTVTLTGFQPHRARRELTPAEPQFAARVDQAHAVGPEQPGAPGGHPAGRRALLGRVPAGGDDGEVASAGRQALGHHGPYVRGRHGHHDVLARRPGQPGPERHTVQAAAPPVHQVHLPPPRPASAPLARQ
ncbi:hypothetical protein SRB17_15850 [Streptomyces sp. RB17]|nr:hypothetical protein [Streptomyces sp. RB17]